MTSRRYTRLMSLPDIGDAGLNKLRRTRIALVGCGTLGGYYAMALARLNLDLLRLIDRDIVEEHNLATQLLFEEEDVGNLLPKALVAEKRLAAVNSGLQIEAHSADLTSRSAEKLLGSVDLIIDATDNFETRFLINDFAVKSNISWIYTGVVGYTGSVMAVRPNRSACLRCTIENPPDAADLPTCETAGVWLGAAQAITAVGLTMALKLLLGKDPDTCLNEIDFVSDRWTRIEVQKRPGCPTCDQSNFEYLEGRIASQAARLCGRETVYILPDRAMSLDLQALARRLSDAADVAVSEELLRVNVPEAEIYLFPDGRAFLKGITDPARARAIYNRYISS
jgi:adenylyltransferase/sulfurtransferase